MEYINQVETRTILQHIREKKMYKKQRNFLIWLCLFFIFIQSFVFVYIVISNQNKNCDVSKNIQVVKNENAKSKKLDEIIYAYNKQLCCLDLMKSENFMEKEYLCPANYRTIGFGHRIVAKDKIPKKINFTYAYDLLKRDFDQSIFYAKSIGYKENNNQQLAVAHAIYCLGIGRVKSIKDFKKDITKYRYYKDKKGNYLKSDNLNKNRLFEYNLYNK